MKAILIGSGNVAWHLGKALATVNMQITEVWSPNYENALNLATAVDARAVDSITSLNLEVDLCILAIKDDAISNVADQLIGFKGLIVHTSGSVSMEVFANKFDQYGVFYPLQTFSKNKALDFKTVPLCLEANQPTTLERLKEIARRLSQDVREVAGEQRKILHLAAVFACNFPNHLYAVAEKILEEHQLDFGILRPLILETAIKVQQDLPSAVQTGPAIRNDEETLKKHQELLVHHPAYLSLYETLSERIKKTR